MVAGAPDHGQAAPAAAYIAQPDDSLAVLTPAAAACVSHAVAAGDGEACGLLVWRGLVAHGYVPAANEAFDPARTFRLSLPPNVWNLLLAYEADGRVQLGLWHSHVRGAAAPSRADMLGLDERWLGRPYAVYSVHDSAWWLGRIVRP